MEISELLRQSNLIEGVKSKQEDKQCLAVWEWLTEKRMLTNALVLEVHRGIMSNLWPDIAGKYRQWNVEVNGYVAPYYTHVPFLMNVWLTSVLEGESPKQAHIDFERIHPFADGNGRTGRMLMWWQEMKLGKPFTEITLNRRQSYYNWFE